MNKECTGRIIYAGNGHYRISYKEKEYKAVLAGSYPGAIPVVGDNVKFDTTEDELAVIRGYEPRCSVLERKRPDTKTEIQTMAANVTHLFIVMGMDENFSERRLERFLVLAASGNITPVVVLTKSDLNQSQDVAIFQFRAEESAKGVKVIPYSAVYNEGLEDVKKLINEESIICLVGVSGAGKSTLFNKLTGDEKQKTSFVRDYDGKGRHTTSASVMIKLECGGWIIDTPGLREVGLTGDEEAVEFTFGEIKELSSECFFNNCTHMHEPGCAVKEAVENGKIKEDRYASYLRMIAETRSLEKRKGESKKREGRKFQKMVKEAYKYKKRF